MKKTFAIIVLMLASIFCFAQAKTKTVQLPPSFYNKASEEVDHIQVNPPSAQLIAEDIAESDKNGTFYKVARLVPVNTTVKNSGSWETLENGMLIWRLRFSSEGARASALYFDKFDIPSGASVYVYSSDRKIVDGPYYRSDNPDCAEYMIGNILGSDITIEYVAPKMKSENGNVSYDNTAPIINIGEFGYVYRGEGGFETGQRGPFGDSESCEVNINCSVGADWRIQQRGVARIYVVEGYSAGYCTGTLINNTSNDGTPYFLTADHCGPSATTSNFNQWKFRFNYEASGCSNPSSESSINYTDFTGCTKVAEGSNDGGSDFYLLKLKNFTTQSAINVGAIYNGWDRSTAAPTGGGAGIHHPAGDIKKISFFTSNPSTATYYGQDMTGASNAHWKITWVNSGDKTGVTEGGSSGSPIFNSSGRVFGTLSGGSSSCSASSSSRYDLYGKMSFHWDNSANGSTNAYKLKPWLDPNNTGATTCDYYDPANPPQTNALTVSPTAVTLPSAGGSQTVSVHAGTSSANWTATSSASWLTVSPTSGSGSQATTSVTLTASANTGSSRTATVTFSHGGTTATVTVTQSDDSDQCVDYNENIMADDSTGTNGFGSNIYYSTYFTKIAEKVNVTGNYTLDKITFADILNTATSGRIAIKVLSATSAGAPSSTELYSANVNISTINNALTQGQLQGGATCYYGAYEHTLNSPINVTGPFFICVDFTGVGAGTGSTMSNVVCISNSQNNGQDNTAYIYSIYSGYTGWYLVSNFFGGLDEVKFAIQAHICPSSTQSTTLTVSPSSLSYTAAGSSKTVNVTSNTSWTATSSASWLTISPASGSNNGTITAVAAANTSTSQRTATITVSASGVSSQTVSVTQAGTSGGSGAVSTFTYDFEACTAWTVDQFSPCTTYDGDGSATYTIQGSTFENQGYTGAYIAFENGIASSFAAHGGTKFGCCMAATTPPNNDWFITPAISISNGTTFSFWARSANNSYGLEQFKVAISTNNTTFSTYIAGSSSSSVSAPVEWTQYTYDLSQYAGQTMYIAIMCVSNDVFAFFIDDIEVSTSSTPSYNLTVSPSSLSYTAAGESKTVNVTSNTSWTATSSASWLTVSPASGSNNGAITAVAAANTSTSQRTATITISGSGITRTVNVTQAGASYNLTVSPSSLSYTAAGESKTVNVTSNTSWTATSSASWLTVSPASGSNNGAITAVAAANTSTSQRTATITVSGSGITRTVNVTQAGATTAIDEEVTEGISVYPNPTSGMFTVGLGTIEGKAICQIVNTNGSIIETREVNADSNSEIVFDCNVNSGVYFVRIISGDNIWTKRVVIEK